MQWISVAGSGRVSHIFRTFQEGWLVGVSGFHRLESETLPFTRVSSCTSYGWYCGLSLIFLGMDWDLAFSGSAHQSIS